MIKFGVTSLSGLYHRYTQFGRPKHASLLLLRELAHNPEAGAQWCDRVVTQIRMPNGTFRETHRERFRILDSLIRDIVSARYPSEQRLLVTDCGVSSGTTSVEFYRTLVGVFPNLAFVATDLSFTAVVVKSRRSPWAIAFERGGGELQIIIGPLVLPGQGRISIGYPLNRIARRIACGTLVPRARSVLQRVGTDFEPECAELTVDGYDIIVVPMLSADCLRLTQTTPQFRCETDDLFHPTRRPAHLLRAMNVLTRHYFDDHSLRRAFRLALENILPGGLFVSGRSPKGKPQELLATIFSRESDRLAVVSRLNGGCEEEDLILEAAETISSALPIGP